MARVDYIASDIHLGAVPVETERAFLAFLEHVGTDGASLLIAGDLFDFWFEYGEFIHGRQYRVLAALARLVEAAVPVTLAGGNHDAWGGRFLREEVGIRFHDRPFRTTLAGRPALVAHGDGLGKGDFRYRLLKSLIRSRVATAGFRVLHPELGGRLARAVSSTEAKEPDEATRGRARFLEAWSRQRLAEEPDLNWVVCGHAHLPALVEVEPRRFYINAGDWLTHFTYVTVTDDGMPTLRRWPGPAAAGHRSTTTAHEP